MTWRGVIEEYRKFLPVTERTPIISLGEGNTPLIRAVRLAKKISPGIDLYLKFAQRGRNFFQLGFHLQKKNNQGTRKCRISTPAAI